MKKYFPYFIYSYLLAVPWSLSQANEPFTLNLLINLSIVDSVVYMFVITLVPLVLTWAFDSFKAYKICYWIIYGFLAFGTFTGFWMQNKLGYLQ